MRPALVVLLLFASICFAQTTTCPTCDELTGRPQAQLTTLVDGDNTTLEVTAFYENATATPARQPLNYTVLILQATPLTGISGSDLLYRIYTNANGKATFDFASIITANDTKGKCVNFKIVYCPFCLPESSSCGFDACMNYARISASKSAYSNIGGTGTITNADGIPAASTAPAPLSGEKYLPQLATASYCPPPPPLSATPALCLPLIMIFSLLSGALYVTGRNPFAGFNLGGARIGRHIRYQARGRGVSVSTMAVASAAATGVQTAKVLSKEGLKKGVATLWKQEKTAAKGRVFMVSDIKSAAGGIKGLGAALRAAKDEKAKAAQTGKTVTPGILGKSLELLVPRFRQEAVYGEKKKEGAEAKKKEGEKTPKMVQTAGGTLFEMGGGMGPRVSELLGKGKGSVGANIWDSLKRIVVFVSTQTVLGRIADSIFYTFKGQSIWDLSFARQSERLNNDTQVLAALQNKNGTGWSIGGQEVIAVSAQEFKNSKGNIVKTEIVITAEKGSAPGQTADGTIRLTFDEKGKLVSATYAIAGILPASASNPSGVGYITMTPARDGKALEFSMLSPDGKTKVIKPDDPVLNRAMAPSTTLPLALKDALLKGTAMTDFIADCSAGKGKVIVGLIEQGSITSFQEKKDEKGRAVTEITVASEQGEVKLTFSKDKKLESVSYVAPVMVPKLDADGKPVVGKDGQLEMVSCTAPVTLARGTGGAVEVMLPVMVPKLDVDGKPAIGRDGQPELVQRTGKDGKPEMVAATPEQRQTYLAGCPQLPPALASAVAVSTETNVMSGFTEAKMGSFVAASKLTSEALSATVSALNEDIIARRGQLAAECEKELKKTPEGQALVLQARNAEASNIFSSLGLSPEGADAAAILKALKVKQEDISAGLKPAQMEEKGLGVSPQAALALAVHSAWENSVGGADFKAHLVSSSKLKGDELKAQFADAALKCLENKTPAQIAAMTPAEYKAAVNDYIAGLQQKGALPPDNAKSITDAVRPEMFNALKKEIGDFKAELARAKVPEPVVNQLYGTGANPQGSGIPIFQVDILSNTGNLMKEDKGTGIWREHHTVELLSKPQYSGSLSMPNEARSNIQLDKPLENMAGMIGALQQGIFKGDFRTPLSNEFVKSERDYWDFGLKEEMKRAGGFKGNETERADGGTSNLAHALDFRRILPAGADSPDDYAKLLANKWHDAHTQMSEGNLPAAQGQVASIYQQMHSFNQAAELKASELEQRVALVQPAGTSQPITAQWVKNELASTTSAANRLYQALTGGETLSTADMPNMHELVRNALSEGKSLPPADVLKLYELGQKAALLGNLTQARETAMASRAALDQVSSAIGQLSQARSGTIPVDMGPQPDFERVSREVFGSMNTSEAAGRADLAAVRASVEFRLGPIGQAVEGMERRPPAPPAEAPRRGGGGGEEPPKPPPETPPSKPSEQPQLAKERETPPSRSELQREQPAKAPVEETPQRGSKAPIERSGVSIATQEELEKKERKRQEEKKKRG
ncbi:MAG: hypothetical protein PHV13_03050 [Candidatus ainarchaeum sp.]|nr:hypothetical protein [Candidatus ainarchaeum sp.]